MARGQRCAGVRKLASFLEQCVPSRLVDADPATIGVQTSGQGVASCGLGL